jgi:hypothetical protein
MMLKFVKTVEDLGLSGKRENFWSKRETNLNNRFRWAVMLGRSRK